MKAQIQSGVIYLGLAAGIALLWLSGAGARGVQAIRDAAAGAPSLTIPNLGYRPPADRVPGRRPT